MSKIGQNPIPLTQAVQIDIQNHTIAVKGPKGQMAIELPTYLSAIKQEDTLVISRKNDSKRQKSAHGLFRSLLANAVAGVQEEWSKRLEIMGTGFNVKMQGKNLAMKLGFSHPVIYEAPDDIRFATEGNTLIIVSGIDKQRVGEIAHQIRSIKKPDAYKGKGIRYEGEHIRLKPGKKAKTA